MSLLLHQKDCILSPLGIFCLKTLVSLLSIPGSYLLWLSCHQSQSLSTPFDYLNYLLVKYMGGNVRSFDGLTRVFHDPKVFWDLALVFDSFVSIFCEYLVAVEVLVLIFRSLKNLFEDLLSVVGQSGALYPVMTQFRF